MSTFEFCVLSVVFVSCTIFSTYPTYLGVVSLFCIFRFCFIRVFSFVHITDRFACYSRDYHCSFVLLVFWFSDQLGFIFLNMEAESEERGGVQPKAYGKAESPKAKKDAHTDGKGKSESQLTRDRDIKCFKCLGKGHIASQCPNRRVRLTRDNGEVESESDKSESEEMPPLVDCSDEEIAYPVEGEVLVIRRALNMQIKEDDVDQQQENIFHTQCHIQNKVCSMIIYGGSCANVMGFKGK